MKIKTYKKKKMICYVLKIALVIVGICGAIMILAAIDGITENILNLIHGIHQIIRGYILLAIDYTAYCIVDRIEHWTGFKTKKRKE